MKRSEIENITLNKSDDLCKLAEMLGYKSRNQQLQCNNGAFVSSLLNFFDDNPDAMQAVQDWILESNSFNLEDDSEEYEEEDNAVVDELKNLLKEGLELQKALIPAI